MDKGGILYVAYFEMEFGDAVSLDSLRASLQYLVATDSSPSNLQSVCLTMSLK
jgi:hypothetical protein